MKHTKGPWNFNWPTYGALTIPIYGNNGREPYLADVYGKTPEEAEANAQLIIAAPKMYEACRTVLRFLDRLEGDDPLDPLYQLRRIAHQPLRDALGPAIAQAEGR